MKPVAKSTLCLLILISTIAFVGADKEWPYQLSTQILATFRQDSSGFSTDDAAYAFANIGEYRQALLFNDKNYTPKWTVKGFINPSDSLFLRNSRPRNAREYIIQRAEKERIIIINEAHHNPLHRVFTTSLLAGLYQAGFRYFGAETLNFRDSTLNQRKYPVISSGHYTREPQYGNLIREALRLGYHVFPYEARTPEEFASGKSREVAQARYVEAILKRDPNAKILIHCGYDHVLEVPLKNNWQKAMAGWLKEFTGIDPLTIDQQQWTELSQPVKEHPLYQAMHLSEASVFVHATGAVYLGLALGRTDIQVAHPRTRYTHGRPNWVLAGGRKKPYVLKPAQCSLKLPFLVQAYRMAEWNDVSAPIYQAIPADIIELTSWPDRKALILPVGTYRVMLRDKQGNQQELTITQK